MSNKQTLMKFISEQGYKRNSPDKNNPFNIIPSGNITMKDVDHPVFGIDNLGNQQLMQPGLDYEYPGDTVFEIPIRQFGGDMKFWRPVLQQGGSMLKAPSIVNYIEQEDINSESGDYNMNRALELGYTPDETGHWPSVDYETGEWLKSKSHPTRGMEIMAYTLNPELQRNLDLIENERGTLQYLPKKQVGGPKEYINITKEYNIPQFTKEYILKAIELDKKYPNAKFVCDANGCADIASRAASAMGYDFGKANAWDYGNRSDIVFTNPNYAKELENPSGPLHDPTSYDVSKEFLAMKNVLIGLNRKNNLLDVKGNNVKNNPNAQKIAAAKSRKEANDSFDYANQDIYEGSRGYEHVGYLLDNNKLLHGTAANKDHPAFFVIDDLADGINLSGYGKYEPVEAIAEPTFIQDFGNKIKSIFNRQKGGQNDFMNVKNWYNSYIQSPLYKRNIENSGYSNVDDVINQRQANVNRAKYVVDENKAGSYYTNRTNKVHHSPINDYKIWSTYYTSDLPEDEVLAHELGHAVLDSSDSILLGSNALHMNQYDYNQLESRQKNKKISRGVNENYADQKALQYMGAKLGIYKPGYEEFTKEHLDKIPADLKDRALQNYSEEDLIWLMNNIAQNDNNYNLPIAQVGGENPFTVSGNPIVIPSEGMYPIDYAMNLNKNEAGIPYDKDGVLFSQSKIVSRFDANGKPLTRNQIAENQKIWNDQKLAYSSLQKTLGLWKNNPENTQQGYYNTKDFDDYLEEIKPKGKNVGLEGLETNKCNKRSKKTGSCSTGQTMGGDSLRDIRQYGGSNFLPKAQDGFYTPKKLNTTLAKKILTNINERNNLRDIAESKRINQQTLYDKKKNQFILPAVTIQGKPKEKGFWEQSRDKYLEEHKDDGLFSALGSVVTYPLSIPKHALMYGLSGKVQEPTEALGVDSAIDPITGGIINFGSDPVNFIGAGELAALSKLTKEGLISKGVGALNRTGLRRSSIIDINDVSDKTGFSLNYKEILNLPEEEILKKTGKSKTDWQLYIDHKPDRYGKRLEDIFNSFYEPSSEQLQAVDKGRQQLLDFYNSTDYRRRLQNATGLDFNSAINKQSDLMNAVNKTKPRYVKSTGYKSLESDAKAYSAGADELGTKLAIDFSKSGLNRPDASYLSSHEFGHTSLYDIKNKDLLEKLPKLDLDPETLSNWKKWSNESGNNSYNDLIDYYSNPDEARQRGITAILYSKNKGITTDELVDIPYDDIVKQNRSGEIPNDIMELRQIYNQKQLKDYLKNLYLIPGAIVLNAAYKTYGPQEENVKFKKGGLIKAQEGKNIRVQNADGTISVMNTDSPEYREMYKSGMVQHPSAGQGDNPYFGGVLDEVSITRAPREKGFWEEYADKIAEENKDAGFFGAIIGTPISAVMSLPQLAMTKVLTGEMQRPSEAMNIQNPYGAIAVDLVSDPTNYIGAGLIDDTFKVSNKAKNLFKNGFRSIETPKGVAFTNSFGKTLKSLGELGNKWIINQGNLLKESLIDDNIKFVKPSFFTSKNTIYDNVSEGAKVLDETITSRINDLKSNEGFSRLINQEKEYLEKIGYKGDVQTQAIENAKARINELEKIKARGNKNQTFISNFKKEDATKYPFYMEKLLNDSNISYTNGHYDLDLDVPIIKNNIFKDLSFKIGQPLSDILGKISIGPAFSKRKDVFHHEINHGLQRGRVLKIDDELRNIVPNYKKDMSYDNIGDYVYFQEGSEGMEPSSFLAELRKNMLDHGFINNIYDKVTPELIEKAQIYFKSNPVKTIKLNSTGLTGVSGTRILDFARPIQKNFKLISDSMNKLPAVVPIGLGLGAASQVFGPQEENVKFKKGGLIKAQVGLNKVETDNPTLNLGTLDEVVIQGKPTEFGKLRSDLKKQISWEDFANERFLGDFERNMGQTISNLPAYRKQEYEDYINSLAFDEYVKTHPMLKGEKRGEYIDRIQNANRRSEQFSRAYEQNAPYNDATDINKWRKGLMGLGSFTLGPAIMNQLKQRSDYFSTKEKEEFRENPISSSVETAFGVVEPLTIPVEGFYGNKSFADIASGQSANIPMSTRILGDPLMLVGETLPITAPLIGEGLTMAGKALGTEEGLLSNVWKRNPWAEKLNNPNKSYRVAGEDAYEDFIKTRFVQSADGKLSGLRDVLPDGRIIQIKRPTGFPSFQKGYADLSYIDPSMKNYIYETSVPTFKRGEINPVTGEVIKGRHYAHRPIDMQTGEVITQLPAKDVKVFKSKPHWLKGYIQMEVPQPSSVSSSVDDVGNKFKSEIDWGKWNAEIPQNKALMDEYLAIEQKAKADGTWMKHEKKILDEEKTLNNKKLFDAQEKEFNAKKIENAEKNKALYEQEKSKIEIEETNKLLDSKFKDYFNNASAQWKRNFESNPESKLEFLEIKGVSSKEIDDAFKSLSSNIENRQAELLSKYKNVPEEYVRPNESVYTTSIEDFPGTPEQFVQVNSENFKKAYPEGWETVWRGGDKNPELNTKYLKNGEVIFTSKDEYGANVYNRADNPNIKLSNTETPPEGLTKLYAPKTENKIVIDGDDSYIYNGRRISGDRYRTNYARLNAVDQPQLTLLQQENLNAFQKWMKNKYPEVDLTDRTMTDHFASFLNSPEGRNIDRVEFKKIFDGTIDPIDVEVHNLNNKKQLKSMFGNNGMFDMTNPNIYKSVLPIGLGLLGAASQMKQGGVTKSKTGKQKMFGWMTS